jgi:hypothetical protein
MRLRIPSGDDNRSLLRGALKKNGLGKFTVIFLIRFLLLVFNKWKFAGEPNNKEKGSHPIPGQLPNNNKNNVVYYLYHVWFQSPYGVEPVSVQPAPAT